MIVDSQGSSKALDWSDWVSVGRDCNRRRLLADSRASATGSQSSSVDAAHCERGMHGAAGMVTNAQDATALATSLRTGNQGLPSTGGTATADTGIASALTGVLEH